MEVRNGLWWNRPTQWMWFIVSIWHSLGAYGRPVRPWGEQRWLLTGEGTVRLIALPCRRPSHLLCGVLYVLRGNFGRRQSVLWILDAHLLQLDLCRLLGLDHVVDDRAVRDAPAAAYSMRCGRSAPNLTTHEFSR